MTATTPGTPSPSGIGVQALLFPTLPECILSEADQEEPSNTRRGVLQRKRKLEDRRALAFSETRGMRASPQKNELYREIQTCKEEEHLLETHLVGRFVPQHNATQFLSPRVFFVSPLFRVRSKSLEREKHVEFDLPATLGNKPIRYRGPELRQSDGLVFLALLHMMRDVQVGTAVSLQPDAVCTALFGRYDGNSRKQLREHIQRLQQGLMILERCSVQLCLRFDYPKTGRWKVSLDPQLVELFRVSPEVWLKMQPRLALPDGLATWLYAFIESQTRLIPMQLSTLRSLCGSEASDKSFSNRFRDALNNLTKTEIICPGWSIADGLVRWKKA